MDAGAKAAWFAFPADLTFHEASESLSYHWVMARMDLYIKVQIDLASKEEDPKKLAAEICRQILKVYGVRAAELSNFVLPD